MVAQYAVDAVKGFLVQGVIVHAWKMINLFPGQGDADVVTIAHFGTRR
jgi:hypothetical protein